MELSSLRLFTAVAEQGGVTRAAQALHCVQSNVSARLRQLEDELGTALFHRDRRQMIMTPAGRELLGYARRLTALADEAREAVRGAAPSGQLRLGSMETTAAIRLPLPLADYHRRYPAVHLSLETGPTRMLIDQVCDYRLDAAFIAGPVSDPQLDGCRLWREELVLVTEAGHAPVGQAADLPAPTLLAFRAGCAYRERLEHWCRTEGVFPASILEFGSFQAILGCAAAGMGIALLPKTVVDAQRDMHLPLALHRLPSAVADAETWLVWRRDRAPRALLALVELLGPGPSADQHAARDAAAPC